MEEETQDMEMFDIKKVLEEIREYRKVNREDILEFLLQEKHDDTAFFFYKNMLLQLVELDEHFIHMLGEYDGKLRTGDKLAPFLHEKLHSFCYGDTEELKKIFEFASQVTELYNHRTEWYELEDLTKEWRLLTTREASTSREINKNEEEREELKKIIERIDNKIKSMGRGLKGIGHFFEKQKLQKQKLELNNAIAELEGENITLKAERKESGEKAALKIQQVREVFASINMQELGEKIIGNFEFSAGDLGFFDREYGSIKRYFKAFQDDVYSMTQFMSGLSSCLQAINQGMDLERICRGVRKQLGRANCRNNGASWEVGIRTQDLRNSGDFIGETSSRATTVREDFGKLSEQFKEALAEEDDIEFIKKCADFHFDFTRVHPFTDANGRTSRILMSMMLATRNYMLPSLYTTVYEKQVLYERSNTALEGDYSTIEQDVFERLGHFYPLILPRIEKEQDGSATLLNQDSVGIDELENISNSVNAQEKEEGINDMKKLAEKSQAKDNKIIDQDEK